MLTAESFAAQQTTSGLAIWNNVLIIAGNEMTPAFFRP
jgi:hypothetical protein